ncbi:MAG: copper chaperone PCu(A)C [Gammaproteobacteria bacterium]|nr:copper chaperone PCu(A)C [Gammaproteobacteria bacterium]MDH5735601.1 copper chaperone PCu(A)C [Gammaproteobacteria bacterium]
MIKHIHLILTIFILSLISTSSYAHHLIVRNAWIPEAPPVTSVMAAFMSIENSSKRDIEIISISSRDFDRIEMHLSKEDNGIARMIPQATLTIPANGKLTLEHGSYHLMLYKPRRPLKDGDTSELVIKLDSGDSFKVEFTIEKSAMQMDHSKHQH